MALNRAQDNSLKELLTEVTSQAKDQHDMDNMVSHSPVSTTSPLSSSHSSSLSSIINDIQDDGHQLNDHVIDNDLALKLETIAVERLESEQSGESSCTSGTISEKDEKEPLEKEQRQKSQSCDSLPQDVTELEEGGAKTIKGPECSEINKDLLNEIDDDGQNIGVSRVTPNDAIMEMLDLNEDTLDQVSEIITDTKNSDALDHSVEVNTGIRSGGKCCQVSSSNTDIKIDDIPSQVSEINQDIKSDNTPGQVSAINTDKSGDDTKDVITKEIIGTGTVDKIATLKPDISSSGDVDENS